MDKLRRKYYKYWTNLNKSRILRIWRENVLSLRLQRNRDKSVSRIFTNYNHIRRKYSFSRWYKYSQKRKYKRVLCSHIFGNHFRRQLFLSFHFWHRQSVRDQHQAIHNKKQLMIAISTWRQLKKKKLRKLIRAWKDFVSNDMRKRRTILELFKWKRRDLLMRAWSRIKTSVTTLNS